MADNVTLRECRSKGTTGEEYDVTLLPCRRCGCLGRVVDIGSPEDGHDVLITCSDDECPESSGVFTTTEEAAADWNARVPDPGLEAKDARIAALGMELQDVRDRLDAVRKSLLQRDKALDVQRGRIAALEVELAAIKARCCETCQYSVPDDGVLNCGYFDLSGVVPSDSCNHWTPKEAADE